MSSSTNGQSPGQSPLPVTRNSFNFTSNPFLLSKTARPKSSPVKSKRSKIGPRHLAITEQQNQQQQQLEDIPLDSSTPALQDLVIYIDKSVVNKNSLTGMANALAATVLDKWTTSVTHLIHGTITLHPHQQRQQPLQQGSSLKRHQGQRTPPIITKSLERKMRVVSPAWLTACYNNKERMPESLYPHEMNSHHRMSSLRHDPSMHSEVDENPFGLEPDEFATVESCDSDDGGPVANDRRVTDYFQPTNNNARNNRSTSEGNDDDQPDNTYTDMHHLDFDDVDHSNHHSEITNNSDNGQHDTINKKRKNHDDDDNNDHATGMSYSLIEMSQVQPPQQQQSSDGIPPPQQQQQFSRYNGACVYEGTPTTENQVTKMGSLDSPIAASVERSIQQMMAMNEGSPPIQYNHSTAQEPSIKIDEDYGDYGEYGDYGDYDEGGAEPLPVLPELDPARQPKVTLGREDRLQIWYGEQSFCLDAGLPLARKRNEVVDLTSSSLPPQQQQQSSSSTNNPPAVLSTSTTTTKRFRKSHH